MPLANLLSNASGPTARLAVRAPGYGQIVSHSLTRAGRKRGSQRSRIALADLPPLDLRQAAIWLST